MTIVKSRFLSSRFYMRHIDARTITLSVVLTLISFVILPNVPYLLWLDRFAPTRAMTNIDYLILGTFCIYLNDRIVFFLFIFLSSLDAFVFISSLYHFTPVELLLSFSYARYSPVSFYSLPVLEIGGMMVVTVLGAFFAAKTAKTRNPAVPLTAGSILCMLILADVCNGTNTYPLFTHLPFYGRTQYVAVNVANSGLLAADVTSFLPEAHPKAAHVRSASQIAFREWRTLQAAGTPKTNMALILVESWGEFNGQDSLNRAVASPLFSRQMFDRYRIASGTVPFKGSTTNAELRELCGINGRYRDLVRLHDLDCLPKIFHDYGYTSTGMHGFYGDMFDRKSWWPLIGIDNRIFLEDFDKTIRREKCGSAFPGLCDDILINQMAYKLRYSQQFVYGLTINSHLPLSPSKSSNGTLDCNRLPVILHEVRCSLAQHWRKVFDGIARNALRSDIFPTVFVVVGDHSPPLMTSGEYDFSSNRVPYIILVPRTKPHER